MSAKVIRLPRREPIKDGGEITTYIFEQAHTARGRQAALALAEGVLFGVVAILRQEIGDKETFDLMIAAAKGVTRAMRPGRSRRGPAVGQAESHRGGAAPLGVALREQPTLPPRLRDLIFVDRPLDGRLGVRRLDIAQRFEPVPNLRDAPAIGQPPGRTMVSSLYFANVLFR
jgi:hypothetical protein